MNNFSIKYKMMFVFDHLRLFVIKFNLKIKYYLNSKSLVIRRGEFLIKFNNDGDDQELLYIANWDKYFNEEYPILKSLITKGATIVDVGANIGFFSMMISKLVDINGQVFSFEPSKTIFDKLNSNLKLNSFVNIYPINLGLGQKDENLILLRNTRYSGLSTIILKQDSRVTEEKIKITSLDNYFYNKSIKIDLIKIDTEGFEPEVLLGAKRILKEHKPQIYIELGGGKFLKSSKQAINILIEYGYKLSIMESELDQIPAGKNFVAIPVK